MGIYRYTASVDNTITNAYASNLKTRGTGSNMGASDILEIFSIYAQASTSSLEKSRVLIDFPITEIINDRTEGKIPQSGNVNFYLRLFNAKHSQTLPKDYKLVVAPISREWQEGSGLDMEEYTDLGYSNWVVAMSNSSGITNWSSEGGDYLMASPHVYEQHFEKGTEDLFVDVTSLAEEWIAGNIDKNGFGVFLSSSYEDGSFDRSYYTKKFFGRGTEFFFKRPLIEARWDSSERDDAVNFFRSSSLAPAADNLNTLYFYNNIRGQKVNVPSVGTGPIYLSLYSSLGSGPLGLPSGGGVVAAGDTNATGSHVETGMYKVSLAYTSSGDTIYPVWHDGTNQLLTGSVIEVKDFKDYHANFSGPFHVSLANLKPAYSRDETATIRLFVRERDWSPTIYTKAKKEPEGVIVEDIYFKINRVIDNYEVIGYGTGSDNHTLLSYDKDGSYFNLDMNLLEKDYLYEMALLFKINGNFEEQEQKFKFRVE